MLRTVRHPTLFAALAATLLVSACDGDDPAAVVAVPPADAPPITVTVVPSLGLVSGGTVVWRRASGRLIASGVTDVVSGTVTLEIPGDEAGPFVVSVCGNDAATYFDEALLQMVPLGAGQCLRAVVPDMSRTEIGVTAFTEAATRYVEQHGGFEDASGREFLWALRRIGNSSMPELADILIAPTPVGSADYPVLLSTTPSGQYALKLALLTRAAGALALTRGGVGTAPAWDIAEQLAADLADGRFDGQENYVFIVSPVYDIFHLDALMRAELDTLVLANPALETLANTLGSGPLFTRISLPDGSDPLLSWQGTYQGTWSLGSGVSLAVSLRNFFPAVYQPLLGQLVEGGPCSITIDNGTVTVSTLPLSFEIDMGYSEKSGGERAYLLQRSDSGTVNFSVYALLNTQGSALRGMNMVGTATGMLNATAYANCNVDP